MRLALSIALLLLWPISARCDPVIDIAEPRVEIRSFFSGADIFIFGAATCAPPECDILVRIEGPPTPTVVRKKTKVAGIWVNGPSRTFTDVSGYAATASTRPLMDVLPEEGYAAFQLPSAHTPLAWPQTEQDFLAGLIDDKSRSGLYQVAPSEVIVREGQLFRTRFQAPAAIPTGQYAISVITVKDKVVTGRSKTELTIQKAGFEAFVSNAASTQPLAYAIASVLLALSIGFISATLFTRR
ncbi:MAG: TIGR02186 family protein [Pseudomonadota bacterium]